MPYIQEHRGERSEHDKNRLHLCTEPDHQQDSPSLVRPKRRYDSETETSTILYEYHSHIQIKRRTERLITTHLTS